MAASMSRNKDSMLLEEEEVGIAVESLSDLYLSLPLQHIVRHVRTISIWSLSALIDLTASISLIMWPKGSNFDLPMYGPIANVGTASLRCLATL